MTPIRRWIESPENRGVNLYVDTEQMKSPDVIGASVYGREFGSWIDSGGRSNPKNAGDHINTAPGIIESILRDELGLVDADIDYASFDAFYTAGGRLAWVNLKPGQRRSSRQIIEELCYEHGLVLFRRRNGTLRLIDCLGSGESLGSLQIEEVVTDSMRFTTTDTSNIVNNIVFRWRRLPHDNNFAKSETVLDSTSAAKSWGQIDDEVEIHTIMEDSYVANLQDRLISDQAIMSRSHVMVELTLVGLKYIHAELGDHFIFSANFNYILDLYGVTLIGQQWVIYEHSINNGSITIKAIHWDADL